MNHRKKALLFLTAALTAVQCGCGAGNALPESEQEPTEPISFTFYNVDGEGVLWDDPVAGRITEKTGVTLEIEYPLPDSSNQIRLMMVTGNYPDLIYAKSEGQRLIEEGALIDLRPLIEEYGPNIQKLYGDRYEWLRYSGEDDAIYQLCSGPLDDSLPGETGGTAQLQFAALKENGYVIPQTLQEYEGIIRDYLRAHPLMEDGSKRIGLSIVCADWRWMITMGNPAGYIALGTCDNGQWLVEDDYTVRYKFTAPRMEEFFRWLCRMYDEGILDPEFATQTYEEYLDKIGEGRVVGLMDAEWNYRDGVHMLYERELYEETYAPLPVTLDETVPCRVQESRGESVGWGIGISVSCSDPVRAVQFIDYLCSDEGQVLTHWGIEGVNYYLDADGKRCRTEEEISWQRQDPLYAQKTGVGLHTYPFPTYGDAALDGTGNPYTTVQSTQSNYNPAQKEALQHWQAGSFADIFPKTSESGQQAYPPLWSQYIPTALTETLSILDEISARELVSCVIDKEAHFEENWENYQQMLRLAGVEELERAMTELLSERLRFWNTNG